MGHWPLTDETTKRPSLPFLIPRVDQTPRTCALQMVIRNWGCRPPGGPVGAEMPLGNATCVAPGGAVMAQPGSPSRACVELASSHQGAARVA